MRASTIDYQVRLDSFEGPLDLLLQLIRRAEVDISTISIAAIADQYIDHLRDLHTLDIDVAAEFLVVAATLMEIKSRVLAPADSESDGSEDTSADAGGDPLDPHSDLVAQLLAYKEHRDAADLLAERRAEWMKRFPGGSASIDRDALHEARVEIEGEHEEDLELFDLVDAFARVLAQVDLSRVGEHHVRYETDDTPIEVHEADIVERLRETGGGMSLRALFESHTRVQMIGLFLATLELVRQQIVRVRQSGDLDDLHLELSNEPTEGIPGLKDGESDPE